METDLTSGKLCGYERKDSGVLQNQTTDRIGIRDVVKRRLWPTESLLEQSKESEPGVARVLCCEDG